MSWFTDVMQDFYNLQLRYDQLKAAFEAQTKTLKTLEATHKECSREK